MEKCDQLKGPIMHCYKIKTDTDDPKIKMSAKLTINSIYGKTLQQTYQTNTYYKYCEDAKEWIYEEEYKNPNDIKYRSPLVGVWVICMSRIDLISSIIRNIEIGHTFLYGDTDSAKMGKKKGVDFVFPLCNVTIGFFKHEGYANIYANNGKLKSYFIADTRTNMIKATLSGLDKETVDRMKEKFTIEHWKALYHKDYNFCVLNGATRSKVSKFSKADIIAKSNFEFNSSLKKITHTIEMRPDTIIIKNLMTNTHEEI